MQKKHINIVLIVCVTFIWGMLGYKYFGGKTPQTTNEVTTNNHAIPLVKQIKKDTFLLADLQRDPFLGKTKFTPRKRNVDNVKLKVKKVKEPKIQKWPQLQYLGFVKEMKSNNPLLLLKVNGKFTRKKANFKFEEGFEVLKFYKDSILVRLNDDKKIILKD